MDTCAYCLVNFESLELVHGKVVHSNVVLCEAHSQFKLMLIYLDY